MLNTSSFHGGGGGVHCTTGGVHVPRTYSLQQKAGQTYVLARVDENGFFDVREKLKLREMSIKKIHDISFHKTIRKNL